MATLMQRTLVRLAAGTGLWSRSPTRRSRGADLEQLDDNPLLRWITGLGSEAPIWDVTVLTKNRERVLDGNLAAKVFRCMLRQPQVKTPCRTSISRSTAR